MKKIIKVFILALISTLIEVSCEVVMLQSKNIPCQYIYHYQITVNGESKVNLICIDVNTKFQKMYQIDSSGKVRFIFQYEDSKTTLATINLRVLPQNKKSLDRYKSIYYLTREYKHNTLGWGKEYVSGELSYQASIEMKADITDMLQEFYLTKISNFSTDQYLCSQGTYEKCEVVSFYLQNEFIISIIKATVSSGSLPAYIFNKRQIDNSSAAPTFQELNRDPKLLEYPYCKNLIMVSSTLSSSKQYFIIDGNLIENTFGQRFIKCIQLNSAEDSFVLNIVGTTYYLAKYDPVQKKVNISSLGDYTNISRIPGYNSAFVISGTTTQIYCNSSMKPLIPLQSPAGSSFLGQDLEDLQQFYQGYFLANFKNHYRVIYEFEMDESTCTVSKFKQYNVMPRYTMPIFKDYDIFSPYQIYIINRMCADETYFKTTLIDNEYLNGCYYAIGRQSKQSEVFCNLQCRTCMPDDPNKCTSCFVEYEGYLDAATQTCKCPKGYYIEQGAPLKCKPCINGCDECLDGKTCFTCSATRVMKNDVCDCISPQYFNILKNDCINLPLNCEQANYLGKCTQCTNSFFLYNDVCISGCTGYLYKNQQCVQTCPKGTFPNTGSKLCEDCSPLCEECSSLNTCTKCNDTAKLEGLVCVPKCSSGSFTDPTDTMQCLPCYQSCSTCIGPLQSNCSSCKDGYYRFKP